MTTELVDEYVWREVRGRRGPSTWVVIVAIVVGVALVWASFWARGTGRTMPHLSSSGMSSTFKDGSQTIDARLRVSNSGAVPITVTAARFVTADDQPFSAVTSVALTPTVVPAGAQSGNGAAADVEIPIRIGIDCSGLDPNLSDRSPTLVLTTTGTWPQHEWQTVSTDPISLICDPALQGAASPGPTNSVS
jgi:hypothetical protein